MVPTKEQVMRSFVIFFPVNLKNCWKNSPVAGDLRHHDGAQANGRLTTQKYEKPLNAERSLMEIQYHVITKDYGCSPGCNDHQPTQNTTRHGWLDKPKEHKNIAYQNSLTFLVRVSLE